MSLIGIRAVCLTVSLWLCGLGALAQGGQQPAEDQDPSVHYKHVRISYALADDMTSIETRSMAIKVLKQQALEWAKQARVSFSTSVQTVEVVEAYTQKADGRRLDVSKDSYQYNINKGREAGNPAFSDFSSVSLIFPDLAAGDTTVFAYKIHQKEPIFPGHFDAGETLSPQVAFDEVTVDISYPGKLAVQFEGRRMKQSEFAPAAGRKVVRWEWTNPKALRNDRRNYTVFNPDNEIGFSFSTFPDYAAIAIAYGQRALPKAAPTDQIKALAADIVGKTTAPKDQARALHGWVTRNITYGGNCVGVGTVVPRDLPSVLENKMGDCKDHATLYQALLAARGIESQQALVNAGAVYKLPRIAQVNSINHVINYIPSLDTFVDATAHDVPFGSLPIALRGKPVLLVGGKGGTTTLPTPKMASEQSLVSKLKIAADGSLSGTIEAQYKGDMAFTTRAWARSQPKQSQPDLVRDMLRSMGLNGSGHLEYDDATELADTYRIRLNLTHVEKFIRFPGSGAFYIWPLIPGAHIGNIIHPNDGSPIEAESTCTSGASTEIYTIELPRAMKVAALPSGAKFSNSIQRYEASYTVKNNVLQAKRTVEDRTPVAVCDAAIEKEYRAFGNKVHDNLKEQILYR